MGTCTPSTTNAEIFALPRNSTERDGAAGADDASAMGSREEGGGVDAIGAGELATGTDEGTLGTDWEAPGVLKACGSRSSVTNAPGTVTASATTAPSAIAIPIRMGAARDPGAAEGTTLASVWLACCGRGGTCTPECDHDRTLGSLCRGASSGHGVCKAPRFAARDAASLDAVGSS